MMIGAKYEAQQTSKSSEGNKRRPQKTILLNAVAPRPPQANARCLASVRPPSATVRAAHIARAPRASATQNPRHLPPLPPYSSPESRLTHETCRPNRSGLFETIPCDCPDL